MKAVAGNLYITTDDGSYVRKGMGTDVLKDLYAQGKKYDKCYLTHTDLAAGGTLVLQMGAKPSDWGKE